VGNDSIEEKGLHRMAINFLFRCIRDELTCLQHQSERALLFSSIIIAFTRKEQFLSIAGKHSLILLYGWPW